MLQVVDNVDEIVVESLRGAPGRALNEDTRARWGALAPHRASSIYIYIYKEESHTAPGKKSSGAKSCHVVGGLLRVGG